MPEPLDGLTRAEQSKLRHDAKRWKRLSSGHTLEMWLSLGPSLLVLRRCALQATGSKKPIGRRNTKAFAELVRRYFPGLNDGRRSADTSFLLWLHDSPERMPALREVLAKMTPGRRARIGAPYTLYMLTQNFLRSGQITSAGGKSVFGEAKTRARKSDAAVIADLTNKLFLATSRLERAIEVDTKSVPATVAELLISKCGIALALRIASVIAEKARPRPAVPVAAAAVITH